MLRTFLTLSLVVTIAGGAMLWACTSGTTQPAIPPITAISISSERLARGIGCGVEPTQIYRYAAVVVDGNGVIVAATVSDCFADATFTMLSASADGSFTYTLFVYAYDKGLYDQNEPTILMAVDDANSNHVNEFDPIPATWTTTCTATEQGNVEVLAACDPLTPTGNFVFEDGGADAAMEDAADAADAPPEDAGPDAPPDGAEDAPDAAEDAADAAPDAPADEPPDGPVDAGAG